MTSKGTLERSASVVLKKGNESSVDIGFKRQRRYFKSTAEPWNQYNIITRKGDIL